MLSSSLSSRAGDGARMEEARVTALPMSATTEEEALWSGRGGGRFSAFLPRPMPGTLPELTPLRVTGLVLLLAALEAPSVWVWGGGGGGLRPPGRCCGLPLPVLRKLIIEFCSDR